MPRISAHVCFIAIFFVIFSSAHALTIDAPVQLPENIIWGFSVALDSTDSWEKTSVALDEEGVLDVFSNGTINLRPYRGQFVLKAFTYDNDPKSNGGLVLYVSHFGLSKGEHIVSASSENASDSKLLAVFSPADSDSLSGLETLVGKQDENVLALRKKLADANATIASLRQSLADANRQIKSRISSLEEWVSDIDTNSARAEAAAIVKKQQEEKGSIVGFASAAIAPIFYGVVIIAGIALLVVAGLFVKNKVESASLYSAPKDEFGLPSSHEHDEMADALSGGKWSAKKP